MLKYEVGKYISMLVSWNTLNIDSYQWKPVGPKFPVRCFAVTLQAPLNTATVFNLAWLEEAYRNGRESQA